MELKEQLEDEAWNAERERMQRFVLGAIQALVDHSNGACGITLTNDNLEVTIKVKQRPTH